MYAVTGMSADSSAVRSAVIFPRDVAVVEERLVDRVAIGHRRSDRSDDAGLAGAVDLDLGAVGRDPVGEHGRHDAGHLVLAADDADVARAACPRGRRPR